MSHDNYKFITRQQSNSVTEEYLSTYTGVDNLYDYIVTMGSDYSKNKTKYKYREILYFTKDSDEEFRLVTNIFDMPAEDIVSLYKKRWDIELFFKNDSITSGNYNKFYIFNVYWCFLWILFSKESSRT